MINNIQRKIISKKDGRLLLGLARQTLENYFAKKQIKLDNLPEGLFSRRGVFLPQVAQETGWSLAEFMSHLCVDKAGLSADIWQTNECEIYTFQAQVFKE